MLFHQTPQNYSPEIIALRKRLLLMTVDVISFLECSDNHYSGFILTKTGFMHGDSLGYLAQNDILPILRWVLSGTNFPALSHVHEAVVLWQDMSGVGSGSCGMAAHNFVVSHFVRKTSTSFSQSPRWTSSVSPTFRDQALRELIAFHRIASGLSKVSVTILLTLNHDHISFTHRSDPIALDSSYMTHLLHSQSA